MSIPNALDAHGRVGTTAIMLACGARDDELEDVFAIIQNSAVPEDHIGIARQVRAAIEEVRSSRPH